MYLHQINPHLKSLNPQILKSLDCTDMDLDQIKHILNLVREHELSEFEIEHEGLRLKIRKDIPGGVTTLPVTSGVIVPSVAVPAGAATVTSSAGVGLPMAGPTSTEEIADIELAVVK